MHYVDTRILGVYCDRFNINFLEVKELFKQYIDKTGLYVVDKIFKLLFHER